MFELMARVQANASAWGVPTGAGVGAFIPNVRQSMDGVGDGSLRWSVRAGGDN